MSERPYDQRPAAKPIQKAEPAPKVETTTPKAEALNTVPVPPSKKRGWIIPVAILAGLTLLLIVVGVIGSSNPTATQSTQPKTNEACNNALKAASQVKDINNDAQLYASLDACKTADEWVKAIIQYPKAGILTSYDTKEGRAFLSSICIRAVGTPTCLDAIAKGYTDFKLNDPLLPGLQKYGTGVPKQ